MITNLPPPGGVSPHHHHHVHGHGHHHQTQVGLTESSPPAATMPPNNQDSFSSSHGHFEDEFQSPQGYPQPPHQPQQQPHYQYYPQYPQQYPPQQPQVPHWHHQHGYYNPYPSTQQQPTYPSYSPSDPQGYPNYPNGYYDQAHNNGQQSTQNCTPSPLANSDDSGGDCVNESKASQQSLLRGGIVPLIPRPKGPRPTTSVMSAKRGGKKARQRDPNEPQKPVSAYALFFRDVQAGIKARNPAASFGEVSKHVAALWDGMDPDSKGAYKRRTEQAKKEYLRQLAAYRATLVSKGNTLESPYNGKGLDVTKVGEERSYLMNPRMSNESSGYVSNSSGSTLTPLGSVPTSTSPQSSMGQSPNNGYHLSPASAASGTAAAPQQPQQPSPQSNIAQHHHMRQHPASAAHMSDGRFENYDPYNSQPHPDHDPAVSMMMSTCKRPGCPNPVRVMPNSAGGGRPLPEYCSNDCLVEDKHIPGNPYANASSNWPNNPPEQGSSPSNNVSSNEK